jgi:hypothetical protein
MRRVGRHRLKRLSHHFGDFVIPDLARRATARLVVKTIEASESKSLAPCHDRHPAGADFLRNCAIIQTVRRQKDNLGAPSHPRARFLRRRTRLSSSQRSPLLRTITTAPGPAIAASESSRSESESCQAVNAYKFRKQDNSPDIADYFTS